MSQLLIQKYLKELAALKKVSGTNRESVVREAFKDLLKSWGRSMDLTFIPEYEIETKTKERRYVDGALLHALRVPFGYWEAKDEKDDIDAEIELKFRRGYPKTNIIFEDSTQSVLIQDGEEIMRCDVDDVVNLERLLKLFFSHERPEIEAFRKAVEQFKEDLPAVLDALRSMIDLSYAQMPSFRGAAHTFLEHAKEAINPSLVDADVREMLIQHVLTGEVFSAVFPGATYHEDNSVARELHKLEATFFTGNTKHQTLKGLAPYYTAIRKAAAEISTHHDKQTFLKAIYENFYKVYNPKAADRLGVVYTPNEIVRFMIGGADWLCQKHFGRNLVDKDVDILDPATGTGTFISELIEHFSGQPEKLTQKYRRELHANEVAILPYYVANLNIEATYAAATGQYEEFPGLCLVDTLDNTFALRKHRGHIDDLFGSVTDDNIRRIRQQNSRRISVIIGNPPYNANQFNENENNKNREYPEIDRRIKETYIAASTAQKTKLYDMYARFFRWAADRLDENGVLALITNRSFVDSRTFDGFRHVVAKEFNEIRIVDLGGDVRGNPKLSGTTHNVFGIQTGVAISFMVRRAKQKGCRIFYLRRPETETAAEKLSFLGTADFSALVFDEISPDARNNWINITDNDFEALIPIATREAKAARKPSQERAIFRSFSFGVVTNRDDWVYATSRDELEAKVRFLIDTYNAEVARLGASVRDGDVGALVDTSIKWTRAVKRDLGRGVRYEFDPARIVTAMYRPFVRRFLYFSPQLNEMPNLMPRYFGETAGVRNRAIVFTDPTSQKPFMAIAVDSCPDMHLVGAAAGSVVLPLVITETTGVSENISDWALGQFKRRYASDGRKKGRAITKESIFHYVYAVLHGPAYRQKYSVNLKRDFPHIPFRGDFWKWADWGKELLDLHVGFEGVKPFQFRRVDTRDELARGANVSPRVILKADVDAGRIVLDSETTLTGIPARAWDYKLGNRAALEWILDQFKEKTPKDSTIRTRFNTYAFQDHKEAVIELLARVTSVSVETSRIIGCIANEEL